MDQKSRHGFAGSGLAGAAVSHLKAQLGKGSFSNSPGPWQDIVPFCLLDEGPLLLASGTISSLPRGPPTWLLALSKPARESPCKTVI